MKKIRVFLLFCLMFLIGLNLLANDWEFGSEGGHIVPMNMSDIAIKSEKLHFKLEKVKSEYGLESEMVVTVRFVFDSPEAGEKYIGFITPEGGNDEWDEVNHFKNFKTVVNGKNVNTVSYRLTDFVPKDVKKLEEVKKYFKEYDEEKAKEEADYYKRSYVYYFKSNFKKGENVVEHSYRYDGSGGVGVNDFNYVWTTISKWKNQKVDDFEVIVEPGSALIAIPEIKMKNGKNIEWKLVGEGNIDYGYKDYYDRDGQYRMLYAKLKNGYLHFKTKNFEPKDEFSLVEIAYINGNHAFPEKTEKGFKYRDDLTQAAYRAEYLPADEFKELTNEDLKIMRNYPYAMAGYDFSDKKLKDYFSKFLWYIPIGKNVELGEDDYEVINSVDKIIKNRKK
ncbi:YARHG domain-containing protein [Leptotrichia trevisanii]|uniref:YARHG domain-containing protein n=1 Tax=Leptotrichia trevisanii TaxID=109328 RepID=UPI00041F7DE0|nr:YARHG domain-containing protein [Leptotrichia trevisanii]